MREIDLQTWARRNVYGLFQIATGRFIKFPSRWT